MQSGMLTGMTTSLPADYLRRFSAALVLEIKAEMGRRDLSSRGLGRLAGKSSQYMSDRLDGGSSKTGERVTLNVTDIVLFGNAMGIHPAELIRRAKAIADGDDPGATIYRFPTGPSDPPSTVTDADLYDEPSAAEPKRRDDGGDDSDGRS